MFLISVCLSCFNGYNFVVMKGHLSYLWILSLGYWGVPQGWILMYWMPDCSDLTGEDAFLATVIHDVNGNSIQFKLAPTYTLYMAVRYRVHKLKHMDMSTNEHSHWINAFTNKIVNVMQRTIQVRDIVLYIYTWIIYRLVSVCSGIMFIRKYLLEYHVE